jgi:alpha-L-fucosidase 2
MTYMAYQAAGHFDEGLSYLDFLWDRRPRFQRFAREFYGTGGLATPGVMTLAGAPLAGWVQYSLSPTMSAWSAHLFYLHWRYTMDDTFLRERAYPWASDVGACMLGLLKPDANGVLVLPLSSSPEVFDNSHRAWLQPNSNYDLMSLRMLFLALARWPTRLVDRTKLAGGERPPTSWGRTTSGRTARSGCPLTRTFPAVTGTSPTSWASIPST